MERLLELLGRLNDESQSEPLSDEELAELGEAIRTEAADNDDLTLEQLTELGDAAEQVRAEEATRAEQATADAEARAEQLARITGPETEATDEPEASDTPADDDGETDDDGDEGDGEPEPEEAAAEEAPAEQPEAVAAAAPAAPRRRSVPTSLRPRPSRPQADEVVILAGGDIDGYSAGQRFASIDEVGEAFAEKADMMAFGQKARVAKFKFPELPDNRVLRSQDSPHANGRKIEAVVAAAMEGPEALTAAGGLCAPVEPRYDQMVVSTARRPLRDSLVRFNASRGGVTFNAPPTLNGVGGAVGFWPESLDTTPGAATKPCLTITCNAASTVEIAAVTMCARIGNFSRRTFAEHWNAVWSNIRAAHAREAEDRLWERMCTESTAVTSGADVLGAARDMLVHLARAAAGLRYRHRTARDQIVDVWLPEFARDIMVADFTRQLPGDNAISVASAEIDGFFRDRNLNVTWSPDAGDQSIGVEAGGALQNWPLTVEAIVAFPGTFLFVDGGELDLGLDITDSTLIGTNDTQGFAETFEELADVGVESLCLTMNVCPSGETSSTTDVTGAICTSGS